MRKSDNHAMVVMVMLLMLQNIYIKDPLVIMLYCLAFKWEFLPSYHEIVMFFI